jgi:hypothetical protein
MIKVKLYELDKHRNETTFRPYLMAQNVLRDVGIEFTDGDSYDYAWVAQASFMNKKVSLEQSTNDGLEFLSKINGDYMLLDGQDSTSLIGAYDVFKESNAMLLLKNTLLRNRDLYKLHYVTGRFYWGSTHADSSNSPYTCKDFDTYKDRIVLSGTNWLSTVTPQWQDNIPKQYDVSALFSYPSLTPVFEHNEPQSTYYDKGRKECMEQLRQLKINGKREYNIIKLVDGVKLSQQDYYHKMSQSKIIIAPMGYGEMAPRDIESIMFGSILIKPYMDYIDSNPMWYENGKTYIACLHDYSDLGEKIDYVLNNFTELQQTMIPYARKKFDELYNPEATALNTYNIFANLPTTQTV